MCVCVCVCVSDLVVTITTTITKPNCSSFTQTSTITKSESNIKTILKLDQNTENYIKTTTKTNSNTKISLISCRCTRSICTACFVVGDLVVPRTRRQIGDSAFSVAAPQAWNTLPTQLKLLRSTTTLCRQLKTFSVPVCLRTPRRLMIAV